jgi:hypothetical protein
VLFIVNRVPFDQEYVRYLTSSTRPSLLFSPGHLSEAVRSGSNVLMSWLL